MRKEAAEKKEAAAKEAEAIKVVSEIAF